MEDAKKASIGARSKPNPPYEPTPQERKAMEAHRARKETATPAAKIKVVDKDGRSEFHPDHPDPLYGTVMLLKTLGTTNHEFLQGIFGQLATLATLGQKLDQDTLNFMLSIINGINPKDETEAMIATQMAAVHLATLTLARRLDCVENLGQQDSAERAFNRLARTFTVQMEALKRHRTGGQQQVRVEHVHVHSGGQAVVGVVEKGGGTHKLEDQPHAKQITHAPQPPMWSSNKKGNPMQVASDAERPLPNARRKITGRPEKK
jgi:hypothetical protein